jgi:3-phenylpropionate/trans-cinnamate dioxygenase ferredoxin reductase subunit
MPETIATGPVVIIGAGQGGFETAGALHARGYPGPIHLIGAEKGVPYQRPPLSKAYLKTATGEPPEPDSVALRPLHWYDRSGISLHCGISAMQIDRQRGEVELDNGKRVPFQHLVLATGARNRALPVPGADLAAVHYLRTLDEANALKRCLTPGRKVVVVGAGFIGLEVAAAARTAGADVTVIEALVRPMARAVSETISTFYTRQHERHGVDMRLGTGVVRIVEQDGRACGVETSDGTVVPADVIVVGIGVIPNTDLAAAADLEVDNGIVVDQHLVTADPRISAIGDCAAYPAPNGLTRLRLESVQNTVDQARCVAARLTGTPAPYHAVPWFWTEQFDSKLQMAGLIAGYEDTVVRGSIDDGSFSVFCFGADRLLGVESVNNTRDHMAARRLLAQGKQLKPEQAQDVSLDLKALSRI